MKVPHKKLLCETRISEFVDIQGVGGTRLYQKYKLIVSILPPSLKRILAEPLETSPDTLSWYGTEWDDKNGVPVRLSALDGDEKTRYMAVKDATMSSIHSFQQGLKPSEKNLIAKTFLHVDDNCIYCYNDQIVIVGWGMRIDYDRYQGVDKLFRSEPCAPIPRRREEEPTIPPQEENAISQPEPVFDHEPEEEVMSEPIEDSPTPTPIPTIPWYRRLGNWFKANLRNILRILLGILLAALLVWLLSWLLRGCTRPTPLPVDGNVGWADDDPRTGRNGGIYNPGNPYTPIPTPGDYLDILPPTQGTLPRDGGNLDILPGNPSVVANRLNILMENEDKSILELARDFKQKYPEEMYSIVYYDDVVKRMQIQCPREERQQLKNNIPSQFAPEYELFVFDETVFEGSYRPSDPAVSEIEKSWFLQATRAFDAWDIAQGDTGIVVAIVDNGFNLKHPEIRGKVVMPYNVWTHDWNISAQSVDHGTHVAGTALALSNNGKGLCGIAPNCRLMPVQVANKDGLMTITSVLDGILYALYQGADVVNVSLGMQFEGLENYPESVQQDLVQNHFKEEERLWREIARIAANHNATIVVASGNDNVLAGVQPLNRPESVITVAAVDRDMRRIQKASFSNYGDCTTISAPGVDIYSCYGKRGYKSLQGTSMAAPIISGTVALMKSLNPNITTQQIICILQNTAVPTPNNIQGMVQIDAALKMVQSGEYPDCVSEVVPSTGDVQILLSWNNYNDLDLICVDPNGETIWYKNPQSRSGGYLEIDMNMEPTTTSPIENIFWGNGTAPQGTYTVYLQYYKQHDNVRATPFHVKVKYGNKIDEFDGAIDNPHDIVSLCSFTVGQSSVTQPPAQTSGTDQDQISRLQRQRDQLQSEIDRVDAELRRLRNSVVH